VKNDDEYLWANPPFSKLARVLTKVALEKVKMVIITPDWGNSGQNAYWRRLLDRLTVRRLIMPDIELYEKYGDPKNLLPKPKWTSILSVLDGSQNVIAPSELDPSIVMTIVKKNRGFDRKTLEEKCAAILSEPMEIERKKENEPRASFEDERKKFIILSTQEFHKMMI